MSTLVNEDLNKDAKSGKTKVGKTMDTDRLNALRKVLDSCDGDLNILVTQVDPDAVGSAIVVASIFERMGKKSTVHYCGNFGHPQNRAIANRYDLKKEMLRVPDGGDREGYLSKLDNIVLVDSSLADDARVGSAVDPVIVIDHHRGTDLTDNDDKFIWIEDVGSACTLVTELLIQLSIGDDEGAIDLLDTKKLAVLLALGIYTDTGALVSAGKRDREAYGYVTKYVTPEDLRQVIDYTLPASHYRNMRRSFEAMKEMGSRLVASLGFIKPEEGDDLSTIADWFLRKDGISLVIVWGIIGNKVRISARNSNISVPLDEFLKGTIGAGGAKLTPAGTGEGGATIDLGLWLGADNADEVKAMITKRIDEWVFGDIVESEVV